MPNQDLIPSKIQQDTAQHLNKGAKPFSTIQKIKNDVDAITSPGVCTNEMAEALLKSVHLYRCFRGPQSRELIEAFVKISQLPGGAENLKPLSEPGIDVIFVHNLQTFVAVANATGEYAPEAFRTFGKSVISRYLASKPQELIECYEAIAGSYGGKAKEIFTELGRNDKLAAFMAENTNLFIRIVRDSGQNALKKLLAAAAP